VPVRRRPGLVAGGVLAVSLMLSACSHLDVGRSPSSLPGTTATPATRVGGTTTPISTPVPPSTASPSQRATPTTTTQPPRPHPNYLELGSTGPRVLALQQRLTALGYWLGTPDGIFADSTQQAVYALQKAAGIERDGIVGPETETALAHGVRPAPRPATGSVIEVDLESQLLMFVDSGKLEWTLNTSTGGGYTYTAPGIGTAVADTPTGVFHTYRVIDGPDVDSLGELWRPRFFAGGFAIHGDGYVPPFPVSHGCVRVSDEAIDWVWAENLDPIGETVWVY
jgi:peptidoglycan hydrolase-like protein with peptidoglycan-binding domain